MRRMHYYARHIHAPLIRALLDYAARYKFIYVCMYVCMYRLATIHFVTHRQTDRKTGDSIMPWYCMQQYDRLNTQHWSDLPQSYCISRSSGNWTAELITIWCKHCALGISSVRIIKSTARCRTSDDGDGWDACITMHGAVAGGIAITNLQPRHSSEHLQGVPKKNGTPVLILR